MENNNNNNNNGDGNGDVLYNPDTGRQVKLYGKVHKRLAGCYKELRYRNGWNRYFDLESQKFLSVQANKRRWVQSMIDGDVAVPFGKLPDPITLRLNAENNIVTRRRLDNLMPLPVADACDADRRDAADGRADIKADKRRYRVVFEYWSKFNKNRIQLVDMRDDSNDLRGSMRLMTRILCSRVGRRGAVKVGFGLVVAMEKRGVDGEVVRQEVNFMAQRPSTVLAVDEVAGVVEEWYRDAVVRVEEYTNHGSGWRIADVVHAEMLEDAYRPLAGGGVFVELPQWIKRKSACVNVQNLYDNRCFVWSVLAGLHPMAKHANRVSKYVEFAGELNLDGMEFPAKMKDIDLFEKLNPDIGVHVCTVAGEKIVPWRIGQVSRKKVIDLLLFNGHYVLVRDLNRLVSSMVSKSKSRGFLCRWCYGNFRDSSTLDKHLGECRGRAVAVGDEAVRVEAVEKQLTFSGWHRAVEFDYVCIADFQQESSGEFQYVLGIVKRGRMIRTWSESGEMGDVLTKLIARLRVIEKSVRKLRQKFQRRITGIDWNHYYSTRICHICHETIIPTNRDRVMDHDHLTGQYRGPAHRACNVSYRICNILPVVIYNFQGEYAHELINCIDEKCGRLQIVAESLTKFNMIQSGRLRFLNSAGFLPESWIAGTTNRSGDRVSEFARLWRKFQVRCLRGYGLDPGHYYTLPSLGWEALLKASKIVVKTCGDMELCKVFEEWKRGGVVQISKRYSAERRGRRIWYVDANNLYGSVMMMPLPYEVVGKLVGDELARFDLQGVDIEGEFGYMVVCDLLYPDELHDSHNCYPLAPERVDACGGKLVGHFGSRRRYPVHLKLLRYYLKLGMKLEKVHDVIVFKQGTWMKGYVEYNTKKRNECAGEGDTEGKAFWKLANNCVFGKTLEDGRSHSVVKVIADAKKYRGAVANPRFRRSMVSAGGSIALCDMERMLVRLKRPTFVGAAILDLAKLVMYQFHYDVVKRLWGEKVRLLMTDTDSFMYEVQTGDLEGDLEGIADWLDYTRSVPGKFKNEGDVVEFCGLKSKMYAVRMRGDSGGDGNDNGNVQEYHRRLLDEADDKRIVCDNSGICTLGIGHWRLRK